ncbi:MAG: ABC transporter ATP-binding protein [Clostridiales bacterium]|nr:ABC transporter ATP-binding protein [Clostridiales bacterium]
MSSDTIMAVKNLDVFYGDFQAVHGVAMDFPKGKIISIIGSNGAGKSTLLNAIMGVNKTARGAVEFEGQDITGLKTSAIVAKGVVMSPEGSGVFEDMSVGENLLMGAHLPHAWKQKDRLLDRAFALFPVLKEKEGQLATFLSGGQRQMLSIARALMSDPKLLICDEVSLGLAPAIIKDIYDRIFEVNDAGVTVVLVEQEVKRSLECSDYSYVLVKGRVVIEGETARLSESEVKDAYFGTNKYA